MASHPWCSALYHVCSVYTIIPQKAPRPAQSPGVLGLGIKALIDQSQPVMSLTSPQSSKQCHPQDSDLPESPPSPAVVVLLLVPMFVSCLTVSKFDHLRLMVSILQWGNSRRILLKHISDPRHQETPPKPIDEDILPPFLLVFLTGSNTPQPSSRGVVVVLMVFAVIAVVGCRWVRCWRC